MHAFRTAVVALVLPLAACASTGGTAGKVRTSPTATITHQEIVQAHVSTAYDAVERLRPQWLQSRGAMAPNPAGPQDLALPVVFVDGQQYGDLSQLQNIQAMDIQSIKYLSPTDATTQFGTGHSGGAILVTTAH